METQTIICLVIFALSLVAYGLNKWGMGVVAMITMCLLVITGCLDAKDAIAKFADSNVIIIAGMFVISAGFARTQLSNKMVGLLYKISGGSFENCFRLIILFAFIFWPLSGAPVVARYAIIFPILAGVCSRFNVSPSKAMFSLGMVSLVCGTGLPIGSQAATFAKYNVYLETYGMTEYSFGMFDPFFARIVPAVVLLVWILFFQLKFSPDTPPVPISIASAKEQSQKEALKPFQEVCGYVIFILVVLGLLFYEKLGVPQWVVVLVGAVLTRATGVLTSKEVALNLHLDVVLILVGSLAMGTALLSTGAADIIGAGVVGLLGGTHNTIIINTVFFLVPFIITQFMNNTATKNIVQPLVCLACKSLGCIPYAPILLVEIACMASYLTPMATSVVPMIMGTGGYDVKSLLKQGWIPAIIYSVVSIAWVSLIYPLW